MPSISNRVDKLEAIYGASGAGRFRLSLVVDGATDSEILAFARQRGYEPENTWHGLILFNIVDPPGVVPARDGATVWVLH